MAHLPCVHLDPSQRLLSLIDLHQIDQVSPCNWSSLFGKVVACDDLRPLVITIGLLLDKHEIVAHPSNFTKWTKEIHLSNLLSIPSNLQMFKASCTPCKQRLLLLLLLCDRQQKGCCCFQGRHGRHAVMVMVMDGDVLIVDGGAGRS
jgi:hypothetical protein